MILYKNYDERQRAAFDRANVELIGPDVIARGRASNMGGPFPSSAGAKALTDYIELPAMTPNLVACDQCRKWDDVACCTYPRTKRTGREQADLARDFHSDPAQGRSSDPGAQPCSGDEVDGTQL